ncbi:MAG TPA: tetratricopeptide repeat protein [Bryobacteraceae bacterium]|nr:tetratricopeptide repeat protein [Bryobacteraceae bacterium]
MRKLLSILPVAALAAVLISLPVMGTGCQKLQARDHLNKGVNAFKNAQYAEAVEHFKIAVELDPNFPTARLYLATAYMQQYIPGSEDDENMKMAKAAESTFKEVLGQDPKNAVAIAYLASLYLNEKRWSEAREWYQKLISVDPKNVVGYYSLGFIAWSEWYPAYGTARALLGMKLEDPGPIKDKKVREELKAKYSQVIDDGLKSLDKALEVDPEYDDAMAYENLLIRERADLADSKEEYEKQIKTADGWTDKALATKKEKAEKKNKSGGGIVADQK